jgi:hypothetical protein
MSYFPLDREIVTSTLWAQGSPAAVKVWIYILVQADPRTGALHETGPSVSLRCGLPPEVAQEALDWLCSPDPHSRTAAHEGRRLERIEGGYRVLNYLIRRDKDYSTARVKSWRERKRTATAVKRPATVKREETLPETTDTDTDKYVSGRHAARAREDDGPRSNPLVAPRRIDLERECLALVREIAQLAGEDPVDVIARGAHYKGAATTKLNPCTMSDDRLANTVRDLRSDAAKLRRERGETPGQ